MNIWFIISLILLGFAAGVLVGDKLHGKMITITTSKRKEDS